MKIGSIGYNYVHDMKYENFVMDRPKGPGAVLLLFIKNTCCFQSRRGTVSGKRKFVHLIVGGYTVLLYGARRCIHR